MTIGDILNDPAARYRCSHCGDWHPLVNATQCRAATMTDEEYAHAYAMAMLELQTRVQSALLDSMLTEPQAQDDGGDG